MKAWRLGQRKRPIAHLPSLAIPQFFAFPVSGCLATQHHFFLTLFVEFWGRCLRTGLNLPRCCPALAGFLSLRSFPTRFRKTKTQLGKPPPVDSCANSPLARAELLVHRAAKTSSTFFLPPHFTGAGSLALRGRASVLQTTKAGWVASLQKW